MVFTLPEEAVVTVDVFDLAGRRLRRLVDRKFEQGTHHLGWDGLDDAGRESRPGVYFYRVSAGRVTEVRKMVRLGN
jgi:flagellar hook assembly protein FlgD